MFYFIFLLLTLSRGVLLWNIAVLLGLIESKSKSNLEEEEEEEEE